MTKQFLTKRSLKTLFIGVILYLIALAGCQATTPEVSRPELSTIPTTRTTAVPTATISPTSTLVLATPTITPQPTDTPMPSPTPLPTDTPTPPPWQIDQSIPFFFSDTSQEIFIAYSDGRFHTIGRGQLIVRGQTWSPNGHQFIFWVKSDGPDDEVFVADLRDGSILPLEFIHEVRYVFWSPDGRYLLYIEEKRGEGSVDIYLMLYDFDTQESQQLVSIPITTSNFGITGWSPDSRKIAYVAEIDGQYDLFTYDIETMTIQQLTDDSEAEVHTAWSPIENKILLATTSDNFNHQSSPYSAERLYLLDETGNKQFLAEFENTYHIVWSPSGEQAAIAYSGQICILTLDTLSQTCPLEELLPADEFGLAFYDPPAWSPDGQWLAFQDGIHPLLVETPCKKYYLFNLITNELVLLDIESCLQSQIQWSPVVP